jgi:PPOX class probable F420-dependent enzyme
MRLMPRFATADRVSRDEMLAFVRPRHHCLLVTTRAVVATYPQRAKSVNARRNPAVSACILSDDFGGPYLQLDGQAEVVDMPDALDGLVEYFRSISGEHPDWDEYRAAMARQGKSLLRMTIERWGPVATGGFPPELADTLG